MNFPPNPITNFVKERIDRNQNFLGLITGPTGSGKSYIALHLAEQLDQEFNIDRVVFELTEFLDLIDSGLPKGSVIVLDEAGVSMSARAWFSITNRFLSNVLQSFRYMNYIIFVTVPSAAMVDVDLRRLAHGTIETIGIDYNNKQNVFRFLQYESNPRTGKLFFHYLKETCPGKKYKIKVKRYRLNMPSDILTKQYEKKKSEYLKEMRKQIKGRLEEKERLNKTIKQSIAPLIKQGLSVSEIHERTGIKKDTISKTKYRLKQKQFK